MSDLQTAAKIALEQLKINRTNFRKGPSKSICKMLAGGNDEAIAKLEAALENEFNPPQRKPLTDEQVISAIKNISFNEMTAFNIARAIERAHEIEE